MHERLEEAFDRFGRWVVRNRWLAILLSVALAAGLASRLPPRIDTAMETFLEESDPARILFEEFRDQFGRAEMVIVSIKPPDVFELSFLERLRELHREIEEEVPHIDEVSSLINARSTRGESDRLIVEDLLEEFPQNAAELEALRRRVLASPFYRNTLISEDGAFTTLLVTLDLYSSDADLLGDDVLAGFEADELDLETARPELLTGVEVGAAIDTIREIIARYDAPDFEVGMAGSPVLQQAIVKNMQQELPRFVAMMLATVCIVLFALFRRVSAVVLPLLVVVLSLLSTIGAMAANGTAITPPSQVLPTFLLAVGIGTSIHVLKIFYPLYDAGESAEDAIAHTLSHSGVAIVMTGLTTAGGLLSFLAAPLRPLTDIGTFAPLGVVLAVTYCLVLLPALLAVVPLRRNRAEHSARINRTLERWIVRMGDFSARNPWWMLASTAVIVLASVTGIMRLRFTNDIMTWLPRSDPLIHATDVIDRELKGSITLEVVVDTGKENGIKSPILLAQLDELRERLAPLHRGDDLFVGRTISIADIVKEIHQALNENRADHYAVPEDAALVAQELLLFENSAAGELEEVVDSAFSLTRFAIKVPYADPMTYGDFIPTVEAEFRDVLGDSVHIATTGFMGMMSQTITHVMHGLARSYTLALVIVTPLMMLLLGNLRVGLASMVPNLTPILLTLGVMGWMGVTIDMFTMMIGSIAIGLVVDDTIHFMHGFRRYYAKSGDPRRAVRETLETTGQALLFTSITLALGFLIFTVSQMQNLFYFGLFTCLTISVAFLLDILVSPALMILVTRSAEPDVA